jgi:hypothetical protein
MSRQNALRLPSQVTEPRGLKQLPWPRNLFGELATIEELMAEAVNPNDACPYGFRKQHGHNVSQMLSNRYGLAVVSFWSDACESRWNRVRTRRPAHAS